MDENREVRYQITPKFNIIYELGMPTGRKIRTALFALLVFMILTFIVAFKAGSMSIVDNDVFKNIKIDKFLLHRPLPSPWEVLHNLRKRISSGVPHPTVIIITLNSVICQASAIPHSKYW